MKWLAGLLALLVACLAYVQLLIAPLVCRYLLTCR